jgi:hypothetical protein
MPLPNYQTLVGASWTREEGDTLLSPPLGGHWEQAVLFTEHQGSDYSIDLEVALLAGESNTAGVILRHCGENRYYYAGVGGFGKSAFIGRVEVRDRTPLWSCLVSQGERGDISFDKPYRIRVECEGQQLTLYAHDKAKLSIRDSTHPTGPWGLRTIRTQARFSTISIAGPSTPKCFVIMPFVTSLAFVYEAIREVVQNNELRCHRVDESAVAQPIIGEIREDIENADLIVADLTGRNANVYYEAGLAHALDKPLILLAQSREDLVFDLSHIRTVFYANPDELRAKLAQAIQDTFWRPRRPATPVADATMRAGRTMGGRRR